jgi:hypothetical protein
MWACCAVLAGGASNVLYLVYTFWWQAQSALFLVLLLALASGYCITRAQLRGIERVYIIPAIVFVAGLVR